ncbi:winged helix-turn-helix domain-containing protein [Sphingomonas sp. CFBP 8765]|uniref:winged helix-turn-helix domain-containing protein n=1 Tax=Sphingomonas sp. CFBP 8765 TaxID=2775274 RepID=UPI00177BE3F5|nr:transcriptional regulator [Sphingomonas sp. CFBP 8765]MBD8472425.1 transcriptional regulator [Sphingomonas sp. CFBP 8765]
MSGTVLHFGDFRLDPVDRRLFRAGIAVELNARYLDALILLLEADGALVAKDRFMDVVWRGIPVTDEALTQAIRTLRRTLDDSATAPRYIQTVPKHGYRFVAPIETVTALVDQEVGGTAPMVEYSRLQFVRDAMSGAIGAIIAGTMIGLIYGFVGAAQPHSVAGGGGAVSLLLVMMVVSLVSAGVGGAGIAAGIAATRFIRPRHCSWTVAGGSLGGLITGAFANVIGSDAFRLLFGHSVRIAGATEGVILGAAIGLALCTASHWPRLVWGLSAMLGAGAGLCIALVDGRMMAGSLQSLVVAFPSSQFGFDEFGGALGETGLGPIGRTVTAAFEGAIFSVATLWGLLRPTSSLIRASQASDGA